MKQQSRRESINMAQLVLRSNKWMHRRVERIVVEPTSESTRHLSIDFTLPSEWRVQGSSEHTALVPLGLLRKGPLTALSVTDSSGKPVPVLGAKENGQIAIQMLLGLIRAASDSEDPNLDDIDDMIESVVNHEGEESSSLERQIAGELDSLGVENRLRRLLVKYIMQFEKNFLMIVEVGDEDRGKRSILKLQYRDPKELNDLASGDKLRWHVSDFGNAESVHVEFSSPSLLIIQNATLSGSVAINTSGTDGKEKIRSYATMSAPASTAHLVARPGNRFSQAKLEVTLVPRRFGAITAMYRGAWAVFIVILAGIVIRTLRIYGVLPEGTVGASIPALMLAFGGLLLTWLARSPEDWTTSRILSRARLSLFLSAVLAGIVAVYIVVPIGEPFRTVGWMCLLIMSLVLAIWSTASYRSSHTGML